MANFAFEEITQSHYYIRLESRVTGLETVHTPVLHAVRAQTQAATAVIYEMQPEALELNAIAASSDLEPAIRDAGATLSIATSRWLEKLANVVQGIPGQEWNFEKFPEALQFHLQRLAVVPLRIEERLLGLLTVGRTNETPFDSSEIELASRFGRLLTLVLERDLLQQKLLERKLIERAKGILQQRRRVSEEQAYLLLRNKSRRRRVTMAHLAKEIIDGHIQARIPATA